MNLLDSVRFLTNKRNVAEAGEISTQAANVSAVKIVTSIASAIEGKDAIAHHRAVYSAFEKIRSNAIDVTRKKTKDAKLINTKERSALRSLMDFVTNRLIKGALRLVARALLKGVSLAVRLGLGAVSLMGRLALNAARFIFTGPVGWVALAGTVAYAGYKMYARKQEKEMEEALGRSEARVQELEEYERQRKLEEQAEAIAAKKRKEEEEATKAAEAKQQRQQEEPAPAKKEEVKKEEVRKEEAKTEAKPESAGKTVPDPVSTPASQARAEQRDEAYPDTVARRHPPRPKDTTPAAEKRTEAYPETAAKRQPVKPSEKAPVKPAEKAPTTPSQTSKHKDTTAKKSVAGAASALLFGKKKNQDLVVQALVDAGVTDKVAISNILAQVKAESGFSPRSEELHKYSAKTLYKYYGAEQSKNRVRFKTLAEAEALVASGPEAVGDIIYGGRMGNTAPGEGYKYRGRGFIQITGKDAYDRLGKAIGVNLVADPDLANDPVVAAKLVPAFFLNYKKRSMEQLKDITSVSKAVGFAGGEAEYAKRAASASEFSATFDKEYVRDGNRITAISRG
jgi:putative chitinase